MAMIINTNVTSMVAQTNLTRTQNNLSETINRLSSGLRVNSAKDDAAGLAISEGMKQETRALRQGNRNANDGISVIQTAESSMTEQLNILQRMRELASQAASGTYGTGDLANLNQEFTSLRGEVDRIANTTSFNGINILDGSSASISIQVGPNNTANDRLSITLTDTNIAALGVNASVIDTNANARTALDSLDTAIGSMTTGLANLGASQSNLEAAIRNNSVRADSLDSARSRIMDADFAYESAQLAKHNILNQAGVSMLAQANSSGQQVLTLLRQ